jgi:DNA-binding NtrC family response regulator
VGNVGTKTIEVATPRSSLTPCILDDDPEQLSVLSEMISEIGYEALLTDDPEEAVRLVQSGICRVILADVHLPGVHAYDLLDRLLRVDPAVHVIIITKEYTLESALEAIRRGAADFLPKPLDRLRLNRALDDVASLYDQRRRVRALEEQLLRDLEFHGIVGKSPVMLEGFDFARKVARHYTNVLLVGPTGTGKELVARSHTPAEPGEPTAPRGLQLFGNGGHAAGQPTFWPCARGLYDEVGETSLAMQAKLLRIIQNREVQRVGSPEVRHVNVRLIAATNRDLRGELLAGRFREDLFYRLSTIQIRVPSLTERLEDIPLLVQFFVRNITRRMERIFRG